MHRLLFACSLISFSSLAMDIQMPDASTLRQRMFEHGFDYVVLYTDLIEQIADRQIHPKELLYPVGALFIERDSSAPEKYFFPAIQDELFHLLLLENPKALKWSIKHFRRLYPFIRYGFPIAATEESE